MLDISDEVCELLLNRLSEALEGRPELRRRPIPPGLKLRIQKGGAHLSLCFPSEGDKIVSYQGKSVLIIAAKDLDELSGACFLVRRRGSEDRLTLERQQPEQVGPVGGVV